MSLLPVDEVDGLGDLARLGLHRHAVAQQGIDGLVVVVETTIVIIGLGAQLVERRADLSRGIAALRQPVGKDALIDIAVAGTVGPVAEIAVAQLLLEQGDDPFLGRFLRRADIAHLIPSPA